MFCTTLLLAALAADPKPRLDADGIPLPTEAVQRLGSHRFLVNNFAGAAFSPDGKVVYTISGGDSGDWRQPYTSPGLIAWEVPTGKKLWQAGVDRRLEQVVADPDGKCVWVLERVKPAVDDESDQFQRVRYSTTDGKELDRGPLIEWHVAPALHPTGLIATIKTQVIEKKDEDPSYVRWVSIGDREGKSTDLRPFEPKTPDTNHQFVWSATAERLFVLSGDGDRWRCLTAMDVASKKQLWSVGTDDIAETCIAPDEKSIVVVTQKGEAGKVYARRLDAKTGKELGAVEVPGADGFVFGNSLMRGKVRFDPNGKTVYLIDKEGRTLAVDVATWKTVATRVKLTAHAVFSPDGKMTLAPDGRHIVIRDKGTGQRLSPNEPGGSYPDHNTRLNISSKSDRVTRIGGYREPTMEWDVATGKVTGRVEWNDEPTPPGKYRGTPSADGQKKAVVEHAKDEWRVAVTSANKPKDPPVILKAGWGDRGLPYRWMSFTPDARYLVGADPQLGLHIWDTQTGGKPAEVKYRDAGYEGFASEGMRISPSGRQIAVMERGQPVAQLVPPRSLWKWQIGVYEIPSGKLVHCFEGGGQLASFQWTDNRLAGVIDLSDTPLPFFGGKQTIKQRVELLHLDPATKTMREHPINVDVRAWAAAPFGDTVAVGSSDGLRLYEASTGKLRHNFREQKRPVEVLAFSPDGRRLAAESVDGPILVWDVRGDLTKPAKPDAAGWDAAWKALTGDDAEKAFAAVRVFAALPDDGSAELKTRFAGVKSPAVVACERAVEAVRWADGEGARKLLAEWAKGPEASALTTAAKRK